MDVPHIRKEGDETALINLVHVLQSGGEGGDVDLARAVQLFSRAVDQRYENSMVYLARLLTTGAEGVSIDTARAKELYTRAIEDGIDDRRIRFATEELLAVQQSLTEYPYIK